MLTTTPTDVHSKEQQNIVELALIKRISENKDREALAELYECYRLPLGSFLPSKLREKRLIDEAFNDVMMVVWKQASKFRGDSKVSTWIFGIAYRTSLAMARKESKHTDRNQEYDLDNIAQSEDSDAAEHVRAAITDLSEKHRSVIELTYYFGHSLIEISEIIDCPVSTVKTRLFYARQKMKSYIEERINTPGS